MKSAMIAVLCLLGPAAGHAACTGSGASWSCAAGSAYGDVQTALSNAADGATITFQPGTYRMTGFAEFDPNKSATLICATPPLANGANPVNPCLIDVSGNGGPTFGSQWFGSATYNQVYRISGFTFDAGGGQAGGYAGTIWFSNYNGGGGLYTKTVVNNIRVDHNTFQNASEGARNGLMLGGAGSPFDTGNYYGVIDHNAWSNSITLMALEYINAIDFNPPPAQSATANNLFFEDNVLNFASMSANVGCTDAWGGAAFVFRFNTSTNCRYTFHGEKHEGGPANIEFYGNKVMFDNNAAPGSWFQDGTWAFQEQGSGEMTLFNNSFSATLGHSNWVLETQDYRSASGGNGNGYMPDVLAGVVPMCDGNMVNWSGIAGLSDGNRTPIETYRGYPCWRQAGRDFHHVLKPLYIWNNFWSDTGAQTPFLLNDFGGTTPPDYLSNHIQPNRDYYQAVSNSAQASPNSPFNGSSGMGFGTLANRPATCTPTPEALDAGQGGVGYWATDQGSWKKAAPSQGYWPSGTQGVLFACDSANHWTVHYTPFTYPHPLVTGGAIADLMLPAKPNGLVLR